MATSTSTPRTSTGSSAQAGSGARAIDVSALGAEALGTFVLLTVGLGAAILTGDVIGPIGVALAFGITLTGMASALGHLSGGHFNPAVTIGMAVAGRMPLASVVPYIVAQFIGGIAAGGDILQDVLDRLADLAVVFRLFRLGGALLQDPDHRGCSCCFSGI